MSTLKDLQMFGQSVWLDFIGRRLLESGELAKLVREDGVRGLTSNPAIFEKAIGGSTDYDALLRELAPRAPDAKTLYEELALRDIQAAADVLRPVYDETDGQDGFASLEVSPELARDTAATCAEARRLWRRVERPNVMIKVPATPEGIPAFEELIGEGLNINVTLLFSVDTYEKVAQAYFAGLERYGRRTGHLKRIASVASFFVSRVDSAVDKRLQAKLVEAPAERRPALEALLGKAAVANARLAYRRYETLLATPRWKELAARGARPQRVLFASTGTKNPAYRDVLYVEELIGPDTVNTLPPATLEAFRAHGRVRATLRRRLDDAQATIDALTGLGISMDEVTTELLEEGLRLFAEPFRKLLTVVEDVRTKASSHGPLDTASVAGHSLE